MKLFEKITKTSRKFLNSLFKKLFLHSGKRKLKHIDIYVSYIEKLKILARPHIAIGTADTRYR